MASVTFHVPLQWNPYSGGTFDPTLLINDSSVTILVNTAAEWTIEKTVSLPGSGNVPVRLTLRPAAGGIFTPTSGLPTGVVDSIDVAATLPGVGLTTLASIIGLGNRSLQASAITSGAPLFTAADSFRGSDGADLFHAGAGSDSSILGGGGADVLFGGGGPDVLEGQDGDDVLAGDGVGSGGAGDSPAGFDFLDGGAGADALYGGGFQDRFLFRTVSGSQFGYDAGTGRFLGDTIFDFQTGLDKIVVEGSGYVEGDSFAVPGGIISAVFGASTFVYVDTDFDGLAEAGEGQVVVYNAIVAGADIFMGQRGLTMYGAASGDLLTGSLQADVIVGYGGADTFRGGGGGDRVYAGVGDGPADRFIYVLASESTYSLTDPTGAGADKIHDFQVGQDKLDFSGIAGAKTASIQTLGGDSFVYIDLGANGDFDMTVIVLGATLTSTDLVLGSGAPDEGEFGSGWALA